MKLLSVVLIISATAITVATAVGAIIANDIKKTFETAFDDIDWDCGDKK